MTIRIGTRGSALAQAQAQEVHAALASRAPGAAAEIIVIKAGGDEGGPHGEGPLPAGSGKGWFVKELEEALLAGRVDLAVHSVKDLPTELPAGLALGAILPRRDPRDVVVTRDRTSLALLPAGARVGASSLRRQAQLRRLRRDLELLSIRGNVDTRLRKLDEGQYDAIVLAGCGLARLGLAARVAQWLEPAQMLPAPGQGALGLEVRADRPDLLAVCARLDDAPSRLAVTAERALLRSLGGGCQVPIAALAALDAAGNLALDGAVFAPDGRRVVRQTLSGAQDDAERIGITLASHLRAKGADRLLFGQHSTQAHAWQASSTS
ncbi:MAG: hydroxymethylbilane synthase [Candidatus Omnitrophica bacterium]|nr:hydroxymethylbilane synthase [Candidatus Omnitrophota bacterium]